MRFIFSVPPRSIQIFRSPTSPMIGKWGCSLEGGLAIAYAFEKQTKLKNFEFPTWSELHSGSEFAIGSSSGWVYSGAIWVRLELEFTLCLDTHKTDPHQSNFFIKKKRKLILSDLWLVQRKLPRSLWSWNKWTRYELLPAIYSKFPWPNSQLEARDTHDREKKGVLLLYLLFHQCNWIRELNLRL